MVLVIKPPFLFSNDTNAGGGWMSDEMQSTALGYITFSSLFFLSNTYVVDRSLKSKKLQSHYSMNMTVFLYENILMF